MDIETSIQKDRRRKLNTSQAFQVDKLTNTDTLHAKDQQAKACNCNSTLQFYYLTLDVEKNRQTSC